MDNKKIGIVTPWFGMGIPGGAEAEIRGLALHLVQAGAELEVLTTCVKEFLSDWSVDYHKEGLTKEQGIPVRRFRVRKRDTAAFDQVNRKLMTGQMPLTKEEEETYVREMVNSPRMYAYMEEHKEEYAVFVFIPYMFGTTYYGMQVCPEKSVLIPCLHDESYIYLEVFKELFPKVAGMIFLAQPEYELAAKVYDLSSVKTAVLGAGVHTEISCDAKRFREKYQIFDEYLLYAGRKDEGKNVHTLLRYFTEYKKRNAGSLKLVLIGGGKIEIPHDVREEVYDLGFVPVQDKYDAYGAAMMLCQPSANESFSIVIMESWLCGRPVLVNAECAVTKNFVVEANGGLFFGDYFEFEGALNYIASHTQTANSMGRQGKVYVRSHFSWDVIVKKYRSFLDGSYRVKQL
ncbi:MAG: glycosyltransferase family 4 protein [Eubacterium sp.]|nr:glycosyltransferase family 4 protein [Eubacterium sp.]